MITLAKHITNRDFETIYTQLRAKEQRIYTDEEVAMLPAVSRDHIHYKEWVLRKESSQKLVTYLKRKTKHLDILEIGCGNGWLSKSMSMIPDSRVIGTDINFSEIQQAVQVFKHLPNLHFMYTDAGHDIFQAKKFDVIVFAAAIQYFESLKETITTYLRLLKPRGEIHIIDSPFYKLNELPAAKLRSRHYYETVGFMEMADRYYHHCYKDLENFNYSKLYDPDSWLTKVRANKNPFPWIVLQPKTP